MKITVSSEQAGKRLDLFLVEMLGGSRSQIQKLIKAGASRLNGQTATPHATVKEGDVIVVDRIRPEKNGRKKTALAPDYTIIEETSEYLVINKPAGLLMHGTEQIREANLADTLAARYPEIAKVGDDPFRPGIIHRLDKDASGLILVARNQAFFDFAKEQFQKRTVAKSYAALVHGQTKSDHGTIDFPIARAASGHKMAAKPKGEEGRRAISEFTVIKRFLHYTLLKVSIKTGRTHQIRAHLAALGSPIVGDNLYGNRATKDANKKLGTTRVFLVASELAFTDLAGERKHFKIELPEEFEKIFKIIK